MVYCYLFVGSSAQANTTTINVGELNADGEGVGVIITQNVEEEDVENQNIHQLIDLFMY